MRSSLHFLLSLNPRDTNLNTRFRIGTGVVSRTGIGTAFVVHRIEVWNRVWNSAELESFELTSSPRFNPFK
jgi:hypothetical protein